MFSEITIFFVTRSLRFCIQTKCFLTWQGTIDFLLSSKTPRISCCYCCPVSKLCSTLCNPLECSTPGSPLLHYLPEFAQIDVHWIDDAIQSICPQLPSSSSAFKLSQHQGLLQWVGSSCVSDGQRIRASTSASVLPMNIQGWFPLGLMSLISLQSKGLSKVFSNSTIQKHSFSGAQPSLWSNSHICM